ncbi:MAG: hypothetical protein E7256_17805 [Lachnospiraceae bacterium]|nr:hypothetical protein [Lachnospiraceae bacterium]
MKEKLNYLLSVLLMLTITFTGIVLWNTESVAAATTYNFSGGTGTQDDPYLISTENDLVSLAKLHTSANKKLAANYAGLYYKLTKDLTLTDSTWKDAIGCSANQFKGHFIGNGHTIVNNSTVGLFEYVHTSGLVSTLNVTVTGNAACGIAVKNYGTIEHCNVTGSVTGILITKWGGIANLNYGTIDSCSNNIAITGTEIIGGIAGVNYGTIFGCTNKGNLVGTASGVIIGGIAGQNTSKGRISSCYNIGMISVSDGATGQFGGIVGKSDQNGSISSCLNVNGLPKADGSVQITKIGGAIVGTNSGSLKNCFYLKNDYISGIASDSYSDNCHDLPGQTDAILAADMKKESFVATLNTDGSIFTLPSTSEHPIFEYELDACTVIFQDGMGNALSNTTVKPGSLLELDNVLNNVIDKDGYVFVGWYTNEALTSKWNFDHDLVWGNTTLYPKFLEDGFVLWTGQSISLYPYVAKYLPSSQDLTWTTSNKAIATVASNGKVTANTDGRVTISVFNEITKDSTSVNIYCRNSLKKITINPKKITGAAGTTQEITASIAANGLTYDSIAYWKSNNTAVVKIVETKDKNKTCTVKFMGQGRATLTAVTNSGKKFNFSVKVTAK